MSIKLLALGLSIIFVSCVLAIYMIEVVYGDDNESEVGLCLRGFETHCNNNNNNRDWKELLLNRVIQWRMMEVVNQTLALAPPDSDDFCVEDDLGDGQKYLEYCLLGNKVISCSDNMTACIEAKEILEK